MRVSWSFSCVCSLFNTWLSSPARHLRGADAIETPALVCHSIDVHAKLPRLGQLGQPYNIQSHQDGLDWLSTAASTMAVWNKAHSDPVSPRTIKLLLKLCQKFRSCGVLAFFPSQQTISTHLGLPYVCVAMASS